MTIADCLAQARLLGAHYQLAINEFVDEFRRLPIEAKHAMIETPSLQGRAPWHGAKPAPPASGRPRHSRLRSSWRPAP